MSRFITCYYHVDLFVFDYLFLTTSLFILGLGGIVWNRTNLLIVLISIEMMLLSIVLNFVIFSVYLDDIVGQIFALFILTIAASESAIGLAIVVIYYRLRGSIRLEKGGLLRG